LKLFFLYVRLYRNCVQPRKSLGCRLEAQVLFKNGLPKLLYFSLFLLRYSPQFWAFPFQSNGVSHEDSNYEDFFSNLHPSPPFLSAISRHFYDPQFLPPLCPLATCRKSIPSWSPELLCDLQFRIAIVWYLGFKLFWRILFINLFVLFWDRHSFLSFVTVLQHSALHFSS